MEHYIVNNDKYSGLLLSCDTCEIEIITIIRKTLTCFTNILLNYYTTAQSDKVSATKIEKKTFLTLLSHYYNIITLCTLGCINFIT